MKIKTNFNTNIPFSSNQLKIGEMMIGSNSAYDDIIILKTYDRLISLEEHVRSWSLNSEFIGRKLLPGESVTLIQE